MWFPYLKASIAIFIVYVLVLPLSLLSCQPTLLYTEKESTSNKKTYTNRQKPSNIDENVSWFTEQVSFNPKDLRDIKCNYCPYNAPTYEILHIETPKVSRMAKVFFCPQYTQTIFTLGTRKATPLYITTIIVKTWPWASS